MVLFSDNLEAFGLTGANIAQHIFLGSLLSAIMVSLGCDPCICAKLLSTNDLSIRHFGIAICSGNRIRSSVCESRFFF